MSKSESERYKNDSRLGKFDITKAVLKFPGVPSGVRPGDTPSYLKIYNEMV